MSCVDMYIYMSTEDIRMSTTFSQHTNVFVLTSITKIVEIIVSWSINLVQNVRDLKCQYVM